MLSQDLDWTKQNGESTSQLSKHTAGEQKGSFHFHNTTLLCELWSQNYIQNVLFINFELLFFKIIYGLSSYLLALLQFSKQAW